MDGEVKAAAFEYMLRCEDYGIRIIGPAHNVLYINQAFADLCGVSPHEAIGKKCWQVFASSSCHTAECRFQRILGGEEVALPGHSGGSPESPGRTTGYHRKMARCFGAQAPAEHGRRNRATLPIVD